MAEPPDFDQIVRHVEMLNAVLNDEDHTDAMVEALRQVWNARGAADVAIVEAELSSMMGVTAAGPYVKNLDRALRKGDR
jgi:DNA-binding phage protein